jgi:hypothetical protein
VGTAVWCEVIKRVELGTPVLIRALRLDRVRTLSVPSSGDVYSTHSDDLGWFDTDVIWMFLLIVVLLSHLGLPTFWTPKTCLLCPFELDCWILKRLFLCDYPYLMYIFINRKLICIAPKKE